MLAARRHIVMAHEEARLVGQGVDFLDRAVERRRIAAGEVAARGAEIGHEQRVADKAGIADMIDLTGRRMARRPDRLGLEPADLEALAILEQMVELRAVMGKARPGIEDLAEHVLHLADMIADADPAAEMFLDIGRRREMVGMDMGFQHPVHYQPLGADKFDHRIGRFRRRAPGGGAVIEHGIDHGGALGRRIPDDIADRERVRVEEGFDFRFLLHRWTPGTRFSVACVYWI